jgi:hypothetical protein
LHLPIWLRYSDKVDGAITPETDDQQFSEPNSMKNQKNSITGRDGYIITQALAYASEMLKHLGDPHDEPSNRADMDAILDAMSANADLHRAYARAKLHRDPDCFVVNEDCSCTPKYPTAAEAEGEYSD